MNFVAHHRRRVSQACEKSECADVAEVVEARVRVPEPESFQDRSSIALAREQMGGAEKKKLRQRSDLRAEHVQVVRRSRPREHRDPRAGGDPIVNRKVRVGAKVETCEKMIGAEKNRAQV